MNALNSTAIGTAAAQQSPVPATFDRNQCAIERIDELVSRLTNRIESVLAYPAKTDAPSVSDRQPGESSLHDQLLHQGECLNAISRRLEEIINRVTV